MRKIIFAKFSKRAEKKGRNEEFQPFYYVLMCYCALPPAKEGRGLGNMGSLSPRGIALQGGAHNLLAAKWRPGREGDRRGHSQGAFRDPQWALQGALEEESAGTPCAIGRREKGEDMPTGLMGVNP